VYDDSRHSGSFAGQPPSLTVSWEGIGKDLEDLVTEFASVKT
jgi:hypothetical protein